MNYNSFYKLVQQFSKKVQNYFELHRAKKELQNTAGLLEALFANQDDYATHAKRSLEKVDQQVIWSGYYPIYRDGGIRFGISIGTSR